MMPKPVTANPWHALRAFTEARIALGRAGISSPTAPHLAFQLAHAQARDAVHRILDVPALCAGLSAQALPTIVLHSAAADRTTYLQRPDLGRQLDAASRMRVAALSNTQRLRSFDVVLVVADGLSPLAISHHAVPFLEIILPQLTDLNWSVAPVAVVEQGRVAIGDDVAATLGANMVAVLIGERPGLSSPDSMGLYLTWQPYVGITDASRNCISNVRPDGLSLADAAHKLLYLMAEARRREISGVQLKDDTIEPTRRMVQREPNFLLDPR